METQQLLQAVVSLLFVLALLVGLAWLARRGGLVARVAPLAAARKTLQIVEILPLDMRHKVIRLQDCSTAYLILMGGASPVLLASQPISQVNPEAEAC
jgi:flagellar protein FliO/FliZ